MRQVVVSEFGGPEVLVVQEVVGTGPGPGQVRIAVEAAEVLFLDTQLRAGWGTDFFPMRPPWVPGTGVGGVVDAVGDGADPRLVGRRVVARTGDAGAYAEQVVVDVADTFAVPAGLDLLTATAALHDGVLALHRLDRAAPLAGRRVLVTAAAGSLGHWFVPLATAAGAEVVGAVGSPGKVDVVRALGAREVVDYRADGWPRDLRGPFDVVLDGVGGEVGAAALERTADCGLFFGHGAASGDFAPADVPRGIELVGVEERIPADVTRALVERALDLLERGAVRPAVECSHELAEAAAAHRAIAERTVVGKTVLRVDPVAGDA